LGDRKYDGRPLTAGDHRRDAIIPVVDWTPIIAIAAGVVGLWAVFLVVFLAFRPRGVSVRQVVDLIPDLVRLLRSLVTDRSVPIDVRLVLLGLIAWILSPIDLIPEFIPVLGPIDDVLVAVVALRYVRRRLGTDAVRARWTGSPEGFELLQRVMG
jgi:uncharacterized membrane protein YkvA (DUF1232 family)